MLVRRRLRRVRQRGAARVPGDGRRAEVAALQGSARLEEATKKLRMLSALAHSEWGWHKDDLKMIGNKFISSKINSVESTWQPWLSDSKIQELDRTQNRTTRLMTAQVKSSPVEALRAEIDMPSF